MTRNAQIAKPAGRDTAKRSRSRRGQALVEAALVMMTVMATMLFIFDTAHLMLMQNFITERTREAARAAAVNNWTNDQIANYLVYNSTTGSGAGYMGLTTSEVTVNYLGTAGTPDYRVQVKVSGVPVFPVQLFTEWGLIGNGTYTAPPVVMTVPVQSDGSTS